MGVCTEEGQWEEAARGWSSESPGQRSRGNQTSGDLDLGLLAARKESFVHPTTHNSIDKICNTHRRCN